MNVRQPISGRGPALGDIRVFNLLGLALRDQPVPKLYLHRPLEWIMNAFFDSKFVLDGIREFVFEKSESSKWEWLDIPPVIVLRLRKL